MRFYDATIREWSRLLSCGKVIAVAPRDKLKPLVCGRAFVSFSIIATKLVPHRAQIPPPLFPVSARKSVLHCSVEPRSTMATCPYFATRVAVEARLGSCGLDARPELKAVDCCIPAALTVISRCSAGRQDHERGVLRRGAERRQRLILRQPARVASRVQLPGSGSRLPPPPSTTFTLQRRLGPSPRPLSPPPPYLLSMAASFPSHHARETSNYARCPAVQAIPTKRFQ